MMNEMIIAKRFLPDYNKLLIMFIDFLRTEKVSLTMS